MTLRRLRVVCGSFHLLPESGGSERISSLLNTLLLVSVLLFGFSMQLAFGTWAHEDFVEADARNIAIREEAFRNYPRVGTKWEARLDMLLISAYYLDHGMRASCFFSLATLIGIACSVFLSSIAEDSVRLFYAIFRWVIYLGFAFCCVGLFHFSWLCKLTIELFYPRYDVRTNGVEIIEHMTTAYSEETRADILDLVWDNSTKSMLELSTYGHGLGLFNSMTGVHTIYLYIHAAWTSFLVGASLLVFVLLSRGTRSSGDRVKVQAEEGASPVAKVLLEAGCLEHHDKFVQARVETWTGITRDDLIGQLGLPLGDAIRIWELIRIKSASTLYSST
jgi:hypothetical protein